MNRRVLLASAAAIAVLSAALPASAQQFVARIGHLESAQQPRHQALEMVGEIVSQNTGGAVQFQLFPAGQLGQAREMNEGTQLGLMEGTVSPAAFLAGFNPAVSVLDIPFLYPSDRDQANALRTGPFGQAVLDSFDTLGLKAVAIWPNGRKSMTSNEEISDVEDFAGQSFRVMDSQVLIEQFNAVGASAIALPFGELYTALQTGVVDGQENALDTIATMKYQEVQNYLLISEHGANEDVVMFNRAWWDSLPAEYQTAIEDAFEEVRPNVEDLKEAAQDSALESIRESNIAISELDDAQRAAFREAMYGPSRAAYLAGAGDVGQNIIDIYEAEYEQVVSQ